MNQQQFTPEMTVDEAFKLHAGARRVFARFHLGGCSNCAISESHTIGAISDDYGIPLPMLLESLNALFDQRTLRVGDRVRIPDEIRAKIPQLANVPEIGEITAPRAAPTPPIRRRAPAGTGRGFRRRRGRSGRRG